MNIVYCIDKNYVEMTKKSISSVLKFNPQANIIIVSEKPLNDFSKFQNILIDLSQYCFRQRNEKDRISKISFARLFLPEILSYDKCLYLDGDTICQKPLKELYEMDCEYIAACESHSFGSKQANELGIAKYALTGMMLMNLKSLREDKFTKKCLTKQDYNVSLWCHEETLINGAYNHKIKFIDKKYNYCHNREYENPILEKDAYILHYVGGRKNFEEIPNANNEFLNIPEIKEFIKGKKVALVGNAQSIFEKNNGKIIDNYDVIIRFNYGFTKRPESQGTRTDILILAVNLTQAEQNLFKPKFMLNRSKICHNACKTIQWADRKRLINNCKQASSGFIGIDLCLSSGASEIALFGFDFNKTMTFYNDPNYKTMHDFTKEEEYAILYEKAGLIKIY